MPKIAGRDIVFPFAYLPSRAERRKHEQVRDGAALAELGDVMVDKLGFVRGSLNRNTATACFPRDAGPTHLYCLATRPPLSDTPDLRKNIERSGSPVEAAFLHMVLRYFARLDREYVTLNRHLASAFSNRDRSDISYYIYGRTYNKVRDIYAEDERGRRWQDFPQRHTSAGYVVRDRLWVGGPEAAVVFGIDGTMTFAVCHLLRTRYWRFLQGEGLSVIELHGMVPSDPQTFDFLDEWKIDVLLDRARTNVPPPSTREEALADAPLYSPDFVAGPLKASA